jgi:hypothetical protein
MYSAAPGSVVQSKLRGAAIALPPSLVQSSEYLLIQPVGFVMFVYPEE